MHYSSVPYWLTSTMHWTSFLCIHVSDICVTKTLVTLLNDIFFVLLSFSHINIMSRKFTIKLQILLLIITLIYFKLFLNLPRTKLQKCSKKEGIGRMKTTIACMEREYFEDYFSEIADGHE